MSTYNTCVLCEHMCSHTIHHCLFPQLFLVRTFKKVKCPYNLLQPKFNLSFMKLESPWTCLNKKISNYKYICFKILITFLSKTLKVPSQLIITMWQQDKFNCRLGATHASHFDMHITTVNSKHTRHLFCYVLHSGLKMEK